MVIRVFLQSFLLVLLTVSALCAQPLEKTNSNKNSAEAAVSHSPKLTLLILGDSLSAGYGILPNQSWVTLLEQHLKTQLKPVKIINASISGETTKGGALRSEQLFTQYQPDLLVLELGANDGLRGYPLSQMKANLITIIKGAQHSGTRVILIGNHIPPNYGPLYGQRFFSLYQELSEEYATELIPFMLEGVATRPEWMQRDGLHPNALGQKQILNNILPKLLPLIENSKAKLN